MTSFRDVQKTLIQMAAQERIPILGEFELTSNCNLDCEMCYVREITRNELTTEEWKKIFKVAVDNGMLFALLTGGEIFYRRDFTELYNYLYDLGVIITLYTNGTLINEEVVAALKKRPPQMVVITLYGADNETYEKVARVKNGFDKVDRGISLLKESKINVIIRTAPLKKIFSQVDALIRYAKEKNLPMVYYLYIGPKRNSCSNELDYRLTPNELAIYEQKFQEAFEYHSNDTFRISTNGKKCVALRSSFFVTWDGVMQPCALLPYPSKSIRNANFMEVWYELTTHMQNLPKCNACATCQYKDTCIECDAHRFLEGGFTKCSKYLRDLAKLRAEVRNGKVSDSRD